MLYGPRILVELEGTSPRYSVMSMSADLHRSKVEMVRGKGSWWSLT